MLSGTRTHPDQGDAGEAMLTPAWLTRTPAGHWLGAAASASVALENGWQRLPGNHSLHTDVKGLGGLPALVMAGSVCLRELGSQTRAHGHWPQAPVGPRRRTHPLVCSGCRPRARREAQSFTSRTRGLKLEVHTINVTFPFHLHCEPLEFYLSFIPREV